MKFGNGSSLWTNGTDRLVFRWANDTKEKNLLDGSVTENPDAGYFDANSPAYLNGAYTDENRTVEKTDDGMEDLMNEAYGMPGPGQAAKRKSKKNKVQFLRATDNGVYFTNLENKTWKLTSMIGAAKLVGDNNSSVNSERLQTLNLLNEATLYAKGTMDTNFDGNNFYKFNNTLTVLVPVSDGLLVKYGKGSVERLA